MFTFARQRNITEVCVKRKRFNDEIEQDNVELLVIHLKQYIHYK
jgi:hypothetical protein